MLKDLSHFSINFFLALISTQFSFFCRLFEFSCKRFKVLLSHSKEEISEEFKAKMSYQLAKSANDAGGKNKQTLQPSTSIWMAHWQHSACNSSKETRNHNTVTDLELQRATSRDSSKNVLEVSREMENRAPDLIGESSKMDLKSFRNEKKHNSLFENRKGSDGMQELRIRPVCSNNLEHVKSSDCSSRIQLPSTIPGVPIVNEIASLERFSSGHGTLEDPPKSMKTHTCDTCALNLSSFGRDWFLKMQKCSGIRLLSSECIASEKFETKGIHNYCYSVPKLQNRGHDMETGGIYTTLDSVEETAVGCSKFPQTTQSLLIRKGAPINILREDGNFRNTMVVTKINVNSTWDLHHLSPFSLQGTQGVKLQSLCSSMDSEEDENVGKVKAFEVNIKNRSSAESERMEIDSIEEKNSKLGAHSTVSTKVFNMDLSSPPQTIAAYSREVGEQLMHVVPDSSLDVSALPGARSSSDHVCLNSSNSQSLEMGRHNVEQPELRSSFSGMNYTADPINRSIKRLKLTSNSAQGTKSSGIAESTPHEKMNNYFRNFFVSSIKSSETSPQTHHVKESPLPDISKNLEGGDENKGKGLLLSDAWIKRWLSDRSRNSNKKPETVVISDAPKNQFPSIAAVALMSKAMIGKPFELQNQG